MVDSRTPSSCLTSAAISLADTGLNGASLHQGRQKCSGAESRWVVNGVVLRGLGVNATQDLVSRLKTRVL